MKRNEQQQAEFPRRKTDAACVAKGVRRKAKPGHMGDASAETMRTKETTRMKKVNLQCACRAMTTRRSRSSQTDAGMTPSRSIRGTPRQLPLSNSLATCLGTSTGVTETVASIETISIPMTWTLNASKYRRPGANWTSSSRRTSDMPWLWALRRQPWEGHDSTKRRCGSH